ncbi:MAG: flagellar biosynthesis protein FlhA, partial [Armatimonadota bacterium]|nr:flagellar biosynthesis protein FlhA [Armatimonadota bacterium]
MVEPTAKPIERLLRHSDLAIALLLLVITAMIIMPLRPLLIDILLTLNLAGSVVILLMTMYNTDPLEFSSFPSLLLVATLFRLALNVAITRLILLTGDAGRVVSAFGSFVVGGSYIVGFVIFLILVIVQFIVITNGTSRIAEVAARFTLDAMPGKQMAIDADLNAGIITEEVARQRRAHIERQADFFGAMDGASKFVRGDAMAGILITLTNLLGGILVGTVGRGMPILQALQNYALLTVGAGLMVQIPALLVSAASGIIVTRTAAISNLGSDITSQLLSQPRAIAVASGIVGALGLLPGFPKLAFLSASGLLALLAFLLRQP